MSEANRPSTGASWLRPKIKNQKSKNQKFKSSKNQKIKKSKKSKTSKNQKIKKSKNQKIKKSKKSKKSNKFDDFDYLIISIHLNFPINQKIK